MGFSHNCNKEYTCIFDCVDALLQVYCMPYPDIPGDGSISDVFNVVVVSCGSWVVGRELWVVSCRSWVVGREL